MRFVVRWHAAEARDGGRRGPPMMRRDEYVCVDVICVKGCAVMCFLEVCWLFSGACHFVSVLVRPARSELL